MNWLINFFKATLALFSKPVSPKEETPAAPPKPSVVDVPVSTPSAPIIAPSSPAPTLSRFDRAIRFVMENEDGKTWDRDTGCFTWNPNGHTDPPTKWGVIQEEYSTFLKRPVSVDEVKAMPRETAVAIYKHTFWDAIHGDAYSSDAAAIAIFDTAVNKGLGGCATIIQNALGGTFAVHYGPDMIGAVNAAESRFLASLEHALLAYIDHRIEQYPSMQWARAGWTNRAHRLLTLK